MRYTDRYESPLGTILLAADDEGLTGLWFEERQRHALRLDPNCEERRTDIMLVASKWLDEYFSGQEPKTIVPLHFTGTPFRNEVGRIMRAIPYGQTTTYGEIAKEVARIRGVEKMSAQAVGGAVGHNPLGIIVPCHRVMGANGNLTGYGGGISRKIELLKLEGAWQDSFFIPKKTTAP